MLFLPTADRFHAGAPHPRPERWESPTPELDSLLMPFSVGPRNCVGQNLANLEMRVVLATLLRRYRFTLARRGAITLSVNKKTQFSHIFFSFSGIAMQEKHALRDEKQAGRFCCFPGTRG